MRYSIAWALVTAIITLTWATPAPARDLSGRLFVGPGMRLCLEEEGSLVSGLLRAISVANAQVPIVDLSPSLPAPRFLFVGADMGLYAACDDGCGATRRVGDASDPSRIALASGVHFSLLGDAVQPFEGMRERMTLHVTTPSILPEAPSATPARLTDWLGHLDHLWAQGSAGRSAANAVIEAVAASLPRGATVSAAAMDRLAELSSWVKGGAYEDGTPLRILIREIRQAVALELVSVQPRNPDLERLHSIYSNLESLLERR